MLSYNHNFYSNGTILLVDPGSTFLYWYRIIKKISSNILICAIWSKNTLKKNNRWKYSNAWIADLNYFENENLLFSISKHKPILGIFSCSDSGITLTDQLRSIFTPNLCNDWSKMDVRKNKFCIYEYLKKEGVISTSQWLLKKDMNFLPNINWEKSYIIKPLDGVGGENFSYIKSENDLKKYLQKTNDHDFFILQDEIVGIEFSVDMISKNGKHQLLAMWIYTKNQNSHIKEEVDLIRLNNENPNFLLHKAIQFVRQVLDTIGINFGPSHTEISIDKSKNEIKLIEVNLRLHGHLDEDIQTKIFDASQSYLSILSLKDDFEFDGLNFSYNSKANLKKIFCNNKVNKYIKYINWNDVDNFVINNYYKIYKHDYLLPNIIETTNSVQNCLGVIMMLQESNDVIWKKEIDLVRNWKKQLVE